jgi:hypothetical protein
MNFPPGKPTSAEKGRRSTYKSNCPEECYPNNTVQDPLPCYNGAAGLALRQHSPLHPAYKQPAACVLAYSCSFYSASFKIASPESVASTESKNLVDYSRTKSFYLHKTGTVVSLKKKEGVAGLSRLVLK